MPDWQSTCRERFLRRAIQRPEPEPVYVQLTDEQIALLPESIQPFLRLQRGLADALAPVAAALARVELPGGVRHG